MGSKFTSQIWNPARMLHCFRQTAKVHLALGGVDWTDFYKRVLTGQRQHSWAMRSVADVGMFLSPSSEAVMRGTVTRIADSYLPCQWGQTCVAV